MPTYEYECQACRERVEAVQKFTDPSLTVCPLCGGELRKVFSAVGIVFKGSGFYKNDSRGSKSASKEPSSTASDSTKSSDTSTTKTESSSTSAAAPASTSTSSSSTSTSD
jgi:putative FmdB family regulatory protein